MRGRFTRRGPPARGRRKASAAAAMPAGAGPVHGEGGHGRDDCAARVAMARTDEAAMARPGRPWRPGQDRRVARAAAARPAGLRVHHSTSASSGNLQTVWEEEEDDKWGPLIIERREISNFFSSKGIMVFF